MRRLLGKKQGRLCAAPLYVADRRLVLRRDLVERRVRNFIGLDLRRALDNHLEARQHGGIGVAAIGLRVFFVLPQADGQRFGATNVISSLKPFCLRSTGRTSVSSFRVNSGAVFVLSCSVTLRANMRRLPYDCSMSFT